MWFLKKNLLGLALVVGAVCSSFAADIGNLVFLNVSPDSQQVYWDYLMRYKLWGTEGVQVGSRVNFPDELGWTGTATGNFSTGDGTTFGGPIIIGKDINLNFAGGGNVLTTGPVRADSNLTAGNDVNGILRGQYCVGKTADANAQASITRGGGNLRTGANAATEACAEDKVPYTKTDLTIPLIKDSSFFSGKTISIANNGGQQYLDVPPGTGMIDLFYNSITFGTDGKLIVRMPPGGRLTRVFVKTFSPNLRITVQVMYVGDDYSFNTQSGTYTSVGTGAHLIENEDYAGNLLIYFSNGVTFRQDYKTLQGTYISKETITVANQAVIAGQLIAKKIIIGDQFDGSSFRYVPFDPPLIGLNIVSNQKLSEDDPANAIAATGSYTGTSLNIALSKVPKNDVTFDYCFALTPGAANAGTNNANYKDIDTAKTHMPICGRDTLSARILSGETAIRESEQIKVWIVDDDDEENREFFQLNIFNLLGGVFNDNSREWPVSLQILDNDKFAPNPCVVEGQDKRIDGIEDASIILSREAFPATCVDHTALPIYNVIIKALPVNGTLVLGTTAVKVGDKISNSALQGLKYTPGANKNGSPLDSLKFQIEDVGESRVTDTYTLRFFIAPVNDAPIATACSKTIAEMSGVGTEVCTVSASDVDVSTKSTGERWTLAYSIEDGDPKGEFQINSSTGKITVKKNTIDFEALANPVYPLLVKVTDGAADTYVIVNVTITDVPEAPTATGFTTTIEENIGVGAYLGWINAIDPETGRNQLTYAITAGDPDGVFEIKVETVQGEPVAKVYTKKDIDYESLKNQGYKYTLTVTVTDKTGLSTPATVVINVTDENEVPVVANDTCRIVENTMTLVNHKNTSQACKIVASDPEGATTLYYTIASGNTNPATFAIGNTTGVVTARLAPDYESGSIYLLAVDVSDAKTGTIKTSRAYALIYVIDDNDEPTATVRNGTIMENSDPGDIVNCGTDSEGALYYCVEGNDEDAGTVLTYEIVAGDDEGYFEVVNGDIRVVKPNIDYEKQSVYNLTIHICDDGRPTGVQKCIDKPSVVTVLDGDERPSATGFTTAIDENTAVGASVGTVTGTDPEDGSLTYSFAGGNNGQAFAINETTGEITVARNIDFEALTKTTFEIKVVVTDGAGLRAETMVNITINDINEGPEIDDATMTVAENQPKGTTVGTLELFDPDKKPENRQNTYQAIGGDKDLFTIDSKTGEIKTNAVFDYEAKTSYSLVVRVYDQDGHEDTATVKINIADIKESSEIVVTYAETGSGAQSWTNPTTTLYTNENSMLLQWTADGKPMPDTLLTNLHEGYNVVTLTYTDPTKNKGVTETVGIFVSTRTPEVTVTTSANPAAGANIFTLVETADESDTSVYVNKKNNDIVITIKEPVIDKSYTDSTCNYETLSFTVNTELEPVNIPSTTYDVVNKIAAAGPVLNENPASDVAYSQYNNDQVKVSYTEKIAGVDVEVSYVMDKDGNVMKQAVMGPNGKIDSIEVITVSYQVTVDGKVVNVSYVADAITGQALKTTTVNNSGTDSNGGKGTGNSAPVYMYSLTEGEVLYSVTYDFKTNAKGIGETTVQVTYTVNQKGVVTKDKDGNVGYAVSYTYVNEMGNSSTQSVYIVVDLIPPKVIIKSPENESVLHSNMVKVEWYVDLGDGRGPVLQDSLEYEGLQPGEVNEIVRFYRDKAGNEASDVVYVMAKNTKDVDISVEKPVSVITKEDVEKYYATKEPEPGQSFSISIYNPQSEKEVETMIGGKFKNRTVAHDSVYPGLPGHLGPTLGILTKVPVINAVDGLATLDDLVGSDGMVLLDAVDAVGSNKVTVEEFVRDHCDADFRAELGSDISKANIYDTKMNAKIWVYTSLGQFVDYFSFSQELNDPSYASDAGVLTMYFEMKPDKNGDVHTANGRLYATGAYVYKTEITMKSKLRCDLPPFDDVTNANKMGLTKKVKEDLLKSFGYKRPKSKKK